MSKNKAEKASVKKDKVTKEEMIALLKQIKRELENIRTKLK